MRYNLTLRQRREGRWAEKEVDVNAIVSVRLLSTLCAATLLGARAQTLTVLQNFDGTNGAYTSTSLVQGVDGNFYGTVPVIGAYNGGAVFKITPGGALTTLYGFCAAPGCADGSDPVGAPLAQSASGNFYGATSFGGTNTSGNCGTEGLPPGCGTIFTITPSGALTTLHSFDSTDGAGPYGLVVTANGYVYGATTVGGASTACNGLGCGTIFKITPGGALTTIYSFCSQPNCADGASPTSLVQATSGHGYGATSGGGTSTACSGSGCGTIFKITSAGALTTLYSFAPTDGCGPFGLIQATDGTFYGASSGCGAHGYRTVFAITPEGALRTLHSFTRTEGNPNGMVQATDDNFYGTTYGSANSRHVGTIFKITPRGAYTTLYTFCSQTNCADGASPGAPPVEGTDGNLYGTTYGGGTHNEGVVYSLSVGLAPFVETLPTSGTVGAAVTILGTNLTGASSLAFNGTPATFTVVSATEIITTVPAGATSGEVSVTTPGGSLSGNAPFRVLP